MSERTITVTIPEFAGMSDDAVASRLGMLDGRWSAQTKALLADFGTDRLDLNKWWAGTWQGWSCPCCKREKRQLARLGPGGVLICKLEMHHDHFGDRVSKVFRTTNPREGGPLGAQADTAKQALRALCERFAPSLICQDCNAAEGAAKVALSGVLPQDFTFTPAEVATFIRIAPNRSHEVDEAGAMAVWNAVKEDVEDRLQFADLVASRFAMGRHRRDDSMRSREPGFDDYHYLFTQVRTQVPRYWTGMLAAEVKQRSIASDGAGKSANAKKARPDTCPPTDTEFADIEANMPQGKGTWNAAGADWRCACCGRSKREICRRSRRGVWSAQIHRIRDWVEEQNAEGLGWRKAEATSPITIGGHTYVLVCQDCKNVTTKLRQQVPGLEEDCLRLADLAEVIVATGANRDHEVDSIPMGARLRAFCDSIVRMWRGLCSAHP